MLGRSAATETTSARLVAGRQPNWLTDWTNGTTGVRSDWLVREKMVRLVDDNNAALRLTVAYISLSRFLACIPFRFLSPSISPLRLCFRHCHHRATLDATSRCFASKTISATILRGLDNSRSGNAIVAALSPASLLGPFYESDIRRSLVCGMMEFAPGSCRRTSLRIYLHGENRGIPDARGARNRLLSKLGQCRFGDGKLNDKSMARAGFPKSTFWHISVLFSRR